MRLDFVVQGLNFREMPEMLSIADRYGFDKIKFQMIRNWHTYSAAEFAKHDIGRDIIRATRNFSKYLTIRD